MKRQSEHRLNKSKNIDLTGQNDTTNLQLSIWCKLFQQKFNYTWSGNVFKRL